jgi:hypothetical protein
VITDDAGQALAYIYFEDERGRGDIMKRLTKDLRCCCVDTAYDASGA